MTNFAYGAKFLGWFLFIHLSFINLFDEVVLVELNLIVKERKD